MERERGFMWIPIRMHTKGGYLPVGRFTVEREGHWEQHYFLLASDIASMIFATIRLYVFFPE